jgi:hypothetical protein
VEEQFKALKDARNGQSVYVTVTGREFYQGVILGHGHYDFYPGKMSYKVMVYRKDNHRFIEYFDVVYAGEQETNLPSGSRCMPRL